jgi:hypothetical protein
MTTAKLYQKHKAGEVSRDRFLYEVRRDSNLPWVTNITSYTDAVKILKNKGIISEADNNIKAIPEVDRVNPYFLKRGVNKLLDKEEELDNQSYIKALNKAAKQLSKNPKAFDKDMFADAEDVEKEDKKLDRQEVKKNNFVDKNNGMKKVKVKSLKEAVLKELTDSLKKKESINEDSHWNYNLGSEVHTPQGPGKVKEIIGSTLTVEMPDGSLADYQINTIDHHTEKANSNTVDEVDMPFANAALKPEYKMNKDGQRAISPSGIEFKVGDKAIATDTGEEIQIKNFKIQQGIIRAGYFDGMGYNYVDIDALEKPKSTNPWDSFKGKMIPETIKKFMEKYKDDDKKMRGLKEVVKRLKEATKFHAGGEVIFTKDSDAMGYEADLKRAGVKYTKEKVQ